MERREEALGKERDDCESVTIDPPFDLSGSEDALTAGLWMQE